MVEINKIITDILLEEFFLENLEKENFFIGLDQKSKIISILREIIKNEELLEKKKQDPNRMFDYIPMEQQEKIKHLHRLWELLIKEAIYFLRTRDEQDIKAFKQDFGIIEIKKY